MTVRMRFALLYAGAFLLSGLVILSIAFLSVSVTTRAGSSGPPVVRHPYESFRPVAEVAISLLVLVVLSVAIGWLLAGRLLRPVRMITATARDISASNLGRRLRLGRRDDEFTRLGETLNSLFARLEDAFAAQRHFVANASHELRTPLTAERTLLQVALADPDADADALRAACEQVLELGERQERLINALLLLARSEPGGIGLARYDLTELTGDVIASRRDEATGRGVTIRSSLGAAQAAGDPSLATSLVANLVDNALRYNVPGGWVKVSTGVRDGRPFVSVANTGQVVPEGQVGQLFQPFRRLDRDRIGHGSGHGLGLAIVAAIARAHRAGLTATPRPGGGLDITVAFPPPEPARTAPSVPGPQPARTAPAPPARPQPARAAPSGPGPQPARAAPSGPGPQPARAAPSGPGPQPARTTASPSPNSGPARRIGRCSSRRGD